MPEKHGETTLRDSAELAVLWIGLPILGLGAGWLVLALSGWVASLPWAPFKGLFKLVDSIPDPQATIAALAVGGIAGLVVAGIGARESLMVTLALDGGVTLRRDGASQRIDRASISAAFMDGKQLVLLGHQGQELAREPSDLDAARIGDAFAAHGLAWLPGDPYAQEYRLWVEGTPDLPAGANALFSVRSRALAKGEKEDLARLRTELARLGIVVRDEKKKYQYWRHAEQPAGPPHDS